MKTAAILITLTVTALCIGCEDDPPPPTERVPRQFAVPAFSEVSRARGWVASGDPEPESADSSTLAPLLALAGGIAVADIDLDGTDEILVLGGEHGVQLFGFERPPEPKADDPKQAGTLVDITESAELELDGAFAAALLVDINGDAFPDLLLSNLLTGAVELWLNDDGERFVQTPAAFDAPGAYAPALALAADDVDVDGDIDLFVARWNVFDDVDAARGILWLNDGDGAFTDHSTSVREALGEGECHEFFGGVLSPVFTDVNRDRAPDLLLTRNPGPNLVLLNQTERDGPVQFTRLKADTITPGGALGVTAADLNNDGRTDWLWSGVDALQVTGIPTAPRFPPSSDAGAPDGINATEAGGADASTASCQPDASAVPDGGSDAATPLSLVIADGGNLLFEGKQRANTGALYWEAAAPEVTSPGTPGWGGCISDFNNDGLLDILELTTTAGEAAARPQLFIATIQNASLRYDEVGEGRFDIDPAGRAAACFDYDSDGDLDIFVVDRNGPAKLYENRLDELDVPQQYVEVRVSASEGLAHPIGTRIAVLTELGFSYREIRVNSSAAAQNSLKVHFGLHDASTILRIYVTWGDGALETIIDDLPANDIYKVTRHAE
jgi:hypothetical protein